VSYGCCVSLLLVSDLAVPLVEDVVQWRIDSNRHSTLTLLVDLRDLVNQLLYELGRIAVDEHSLLSC